MDVYELHFAVSTIVSSIVLTGARYAVSILFGVSGIGYQRNNCRLVQNVVMDFFLPPE